jgi:hypothetical protein
MHRRHGPLEPGVSSEAYCRRRLADALASGNHERIADARACLDDVLAQRGSGEGRPQPAAVRDADARAAACALEGMHTERCKLK